MKHASNTLELVPAGWPVHRVYMRMVLLPLIVGVFCAQASWAEDVFGVWKIIPARSTDPYAERLIVRFEPHVKGEAFTLDWIGGDGRVTTSSTILYFDSKPRDFQDRACLGTQSSRRLDGRTVEVLRKCASGVWIRLIRRWSAGPGELVLDITEKHPDGRRFERRLVLEKQAEVETTQNK
jgi:hypothetical protein